MAHIMKFLIVSIVWSTVCYHPCWCEQSDPLERIIQAVLLAFRSMSQKVASKMEIPRIDALSPSVRYSLQLDDKAVKSMKSLLDFMDTCPMCKTISPAAICGRWHISYISKNLLITTVNELSKLIDRLQANQPISPGRSFDVLFASAADYRCANIIILNGDNGSPVEISYVSDDRFRSIVGKMNIVNNKYELQFTPTFSMDLCLTVEENAVSAHNSVLVFAESNAFPSCSNYIILTRSGSKVDLTPYVDYITRNAGVLPNNQLIRIDCA